MVALAPLSASAIVDLGATRLSVGEKVGSGVVAAWTRRMPLNAHVQLIERIFVEHIPRSFQ